MPALGLLGENETIEPVVADYNARLESRVKDIAPEFLASLQQSFGDQVVIDGESIKWRAGK